MTDTEKTNYTTAGLDRCINKIINFIYYYRLAVVLLLLIGVFIGICEARSHSPAGTIIKNITFVITCGSIVIGIFYTILNYEHNHQKSLNDKRFSKCSLTYSTMCDWHKPAMVENLKITKQFYFEHKELLLESKGKAFFDDLEKNEEARSALVSIFNYIEAIAIGIEHGVLDEVFVKKIFKSLMISYYNEYSTYIEYKRKAQAAPTAWSVFTALAKKWQEES